jgi:ketosteroid isomerase-like protein
MATTGTIMNSFSKITTTCFITMASVAAGAQQKNDPAATLQRYLDAVNSANYNGLLEVVSDDLAPFKYAACTPQMSSKVCLATFVNETIFKRHGSLTSPSAKVSGDVIAAVIEVRHDGTRAAGIPRMLGVDTITVKNNKIVSFKFEQDPSDAANKKLAAYNAASSVNRP